MKPLHKHPFFEQCMEQVLRSFMDTSYANKLHPPLQDKIKENLVYALMDQERGGLVSSTRSRYQVRTKKGLVKDPTSGLVLERMNQDAAETIKSLILCTNPQMEPEIVG